MYVPVDIPRVFGSAVVSGALCRRAAGRDLTCHGGAVNKHHGSVHFGSIQSGRPTYSFLSASKIRPYIRSFLSFFFFFQKNEI
jgi:hypothetical protein